MSATGTGAATVSLRKDDRDDPTWTHSTISTGRVRDAGLMVLDLLIGIAILGIIMIIALSTLGTARKRHAAAAGTDSTVVTAAPGGFEFPWAMFFSITALSLVLAWLFVMSQINKQKAEADGSQWLKDTDPGAAPEADTLSLDKAAPQASHVADESKAESKAGSKAGSRRSSRSGGGLLDKVSNLFDLLS